MSTVLVADLLIRSCTLVFFCMLASFLKMSLRRSSRLVGRASTETALGSPSVATKTPATVSKKRKAEHIETNETAKKSRPIALPVVDSDGFKKPIAPVTPKKSQAASRRSKDIKVPPLTPTPSLVNVLRGVDNKASYSSGDIDDATPPPENQPADPHFSNATLVTPGGTEARAFNGTDISPTKQPTTTGPLLEKAQAHLISVDPRFSTLVAKHRCAIFSPEGLAERIDPFRSLTSGICGQQVSGAAAKAIKNKFVALYNEGNDGVHKWPTPADVAETSIERLRTAGLSGRKAEYIQGLAEKFVSGELSTTMLLRASDEEVMEKLIAVRGLGKWSVEMFMCFCLKRMDILSVGDLVSTLNMLVTALHAWEYFDHFIDQLANDRAGRTARHGCVVWKRCREIEG